MKTKSIFLSLLAICLSLSALSAQTKKVSSIEKVLFNVPLHCETCQRKIEKNISFEKGVKNLEVNVEKKTVCVTYDSKKTCIDDLQTGFKKIGYDVTVVVTENQSCSTKSTILCSESQNEKKCTKDTTAVEAKSFEKK